MIRLTLAVAALTLCGAIVSKASQAPPKVVTTAAGVYTAAQASRGEQTYFSICVSCHPKGTYTAPVFRDKWNGHLLSELFTFVSTQMPKEQPGTLEPEEYADVIAYLLKLNGAPAGKAELPADPKALKWIRISMVN
jgi:S-disulfanyl-L-cysteine oxidoreductase SoxD